MCFVVEAKIFDSFSGLRLAVTVARDPRNAFSEVLDPDASFPG